MSGETQDAPSAWQVDPLHSHLLSLLKAERDYTGGQIGIIVQRLDDMDKATVVLNDTITRVPTDLQKATGDILQLMDERDQRVNERFRANEILHQTETSLHQAALGVAVTAQEKVTDKNAEIASGRADALDARITQLTEQVAEMQRNLSVSQGRSSAWTFIPVLIGAFLGVLGIIAFFNAGA